MKHPSRLVRYVDALHLDQLPMSTRSELLVELVHDGLGLPIRAPVMVARGAKPGPVFGITATLHGNELNGIPVIHRLFDRLDLTRLRGTVVAVVVVNVPAYLARQREFNDGTDLNHIMPGVATGNVSQVYAHRVVERFLRHFDYLVDLHTASFGRVNSLYVRADMTDAMSAEMAYLQRPQIIVHNPPSDSTLRGAAMEQGVPAITVEIGNPHRFQPTYIRSSVVGLRAVLARAGMTAKRQVPSGPAPVICERSFWIYADHGGLLSVLPDVTHSVEQGEPIARLTDAFGNVTREYRAPEAGVVVGRSVEPVAQTGARVLHLGVLAKAGSTSLFQLPAEEKPAP